MFCFNMNAKRRHKAIRIFLPDVELILSQVLNKGMFFFTFGVNKSELFLGKMVKSELIALFPRIDIVFTCSSKLKSF